MLGIRSHAKNIVDSLKNRATHLPGKRAFVFLEDGEQEAVSITYGELDKKARAIAAYLQTKQLFGQRVLLLYPPGIDFISAFMGCLYAGAIAIPAGAETIDGFKSARPIMSAIIKDADIGCILTIDTYINAATNLAAESLEKPILVMDHSQLDLSIAADYQAPDIMGETIAYLQYTSGSTSTPKGTIVQHQNLIHSLKQTIKVWRYTKNSVSLNWAPHAHIYGLTAGILVPLYHGTLGILMPTQTFITKPIRWLNALSKYQVTHSGGPNFAYHLCVENISESELTDLNLSHWKVAINGGERVCYETLIHFNQKFSAYGFHLSYFRPTYGMSELAGVISTYSQGKKPRIFNLDQNDLAHHKITIAKKEVPYSKFIGNGQLLPGIDAVIVNPDDGARAKKGNIGEIWLHGKSVAKGYWENPEETNEKFHAKLSRSKKLYFRTGDLGFLHHNELCITGRLKDLVIVHGKKYYPTDLENTIHHGLDGLPVNQNCVIFSYPVGEEEKVIFIQELQEETTSLKEEIITRIRNTIESHYGIDLYDVVLVKVNAIPKTTSGKLKRQLCQQWFLEGKLEVIYRTIDVQKNVENFPEKIEISPIEPDISSNNDSSLNNYFFQDFIHLLASTLKIDVQAVNLNASLSEHHIDSIKAIKFVTTLNEHYSLGITPAILFEHGTLAELYNNLLHNHQESIRNYYQLKNDRTITAVIPASTCETINSDDIQNNAKNIEITPPDTICPNDIAVIGMSGIFPGAQNLATFWDNLISEKNVLQEIPKNRWDWEALHTETQDKNIDQEVIKWGGFIEKIAQFDASFFHISPREAELMDPQQRMFLQIVWKTIEDAGYSPESLTQQNPGLFVGVFSNDYAELLQKNGIEDAYFSTGTTHSILANRVSYLLNFHGPSVAIDSACSSSLVAIHQAVQAIHNGDCSVAIAGGVNALLAPSNYISAGAAGMLSKDGLCKTFDKDANGYVRSEGCAAILLKPLKDALADGDHIYGVIKGTAVNHGGHINSLTAPNPNAQANVIMRACQRADVPIETINYIETHGTGTSLGDPIEINGLKNAFLHLAEEQGHKKLPIQYCALGAVKTHIGHLESAAGIAGVVKVLLSMQHKKLIANLHFKALNPYIKITESPFYIVDKTQDWLPIKNEAGDNFPLRAGVSSFGYGGTNAHIIMEESPLKRADDSNNSILDASLILLSARTKIALQQRLQDLQKFLIQTSKKPTLSEISYTLSTGRKHFKYRCAWIVESLEELKETLEKIRNEQAPDHFFENFNQPDTLTDSIFSEENINSFIQEANTEKHTSPSTYKNMLLKLAELYTKGYEITWESMWINQTKQRISLPTYPFAEEYYWIPQPHGFESVEKITKQNAALTEALSTHLENPASAIEAAYLLTHIHKNFRQQLSSLLKIASGSIDLNIPLSELGLDSITFRELAVALKNYYAININPSLFFTYTTIETLSEYLLNTYPEAVIKAHQASNNKSIMLEASVELAQPSIQLKEIKQPEQSTYPITPKKAAQNEPIAIIGMQGLFPQSKDLNDLWNHLQAGNDLVSEVPIERWDWRDYMGDAKKYPDKTHAKWGGFLENVDQFDAEFFNISPHEANLMDPQQRLLLETAWRTIEDAGYDPFALANSDVGVFIGAEFNEYASMMGAQNIFHGFAATGNSAAILANRISYFLNFHGPSEVVETACSSALVAVHRAINVLHNGECSTAIAGGVSLNLDPKTFLITSQLGILSADGRCKTFDKSANGYVKGEGVATVLLKPLSKAQEDGDHIYAIIKGSAVKHGGKAQSLTAPNAAVQTELLVQAYTQAGISADTVTYVEAHGTGTELGDPVEVEGLKHAFYSLLSSEKKSIQQSYCGLGSIKTSIGHLEPASGIAGLIKVVLSMQHAQMPGNLHFKDLNPFVDLVDSPFYIVDRLQPWTRLKDESGNNIPLRAGVSSFGFGGTIAHAVIEEAPPPFYSKSNAGKKPYYLVTLSAKKEESLNTKIIELHQWLTLNHSKVTLEALSFTLNAGRTHFSVRCAMVVDSLENLLNVLHELIQEQQLEACFKRSISDNDDKGPIFSEIYDSTMELLRSNALSPAIYRKKLLLLADLYTKNFLPDWNLLYAPENRQRIASLPHYPFIKQRYWFETQLPPAMQSKAVIQNNARDIVVTPAEVYHYEDRGASRSDFITHYLRNLFSGIIKLPADSILMDVTYENYGINSLLTLEIIDQLENDFGTLPKTLLYEKNQLNQLVNYFEEKFASTLEALYLRSLENLPHHLHTTTAINIAKQDEPLPFLSPIKNDGNLSRTIRTTLDVDQQPTDIAIIGLNGTYPMAKDMDEFWLNLIQSKDCISEVPIDRWNYLDYPILVNGIEKYYPYGGFIPDIDKFDPLFFNIAPRDAALMDPQERLFLQSAWATFEDAGYTREQLQRSTTNKIGVFVGATYNFYPLFIAEEWANGNRLPLDIQMFSLANRVSYFMNFQGPSYVVDTACSSSLAALHLACESILTNECSMALAGGVNLSLHPCKYHFLGSYGFMSDQGRCASFGADGNGYVPSEGVGSILLKPLSLALKDQDRIYGVIKGSSMNHGGKTSGYTVPNPNAQAELIKDAFKKAKIDPRTISYIEAHGTGTALGDPIEIRGLQEAFESYTNEKQFCAIGSVKSNIGHLEAAAGMSQVTKVLLQMQHKKLAPSIHATKVNPYIDFSKTPFFLQQELTDWQPTTEHPRRAGISSFGAGGTNVHLIIEEFVEPNMVRENKPRISHEQPGIFLLSALNAERLADYAQKTYNFFITHKKEYASKEALSEWLADSCYTSQVGRENMSSRLAILITSYDDLLQNLKKYIQQCELDTTKVWFNHSTQLTRIHALSEREATDLFDRKAYETLIKHWIHGSKISWALLYKDQLPKRILFPTYPFAKRRCWVPDKTTQNETNVENSLDQKPHHTLFLNPENNLPVSTENLATHEKEKAKKIPDSIKDWLYDVHWEPKSAKIPLSTKDNMDHLLIFSHEKTGNELQSSLNKGTCIYCFPGTKFERTHSNIFYINPSSPRDYQRLITTIFEKENLSLQGILYLTSFACEESIQNVNDLSAANDQLDLSDKVLYLLQAMLKHQWQHLLQFFFITKGGQTVDPTDHIEIWQHSLWAMMRVFAAEQGNYELLLLDLDPKNQPHQDVKNILSEIQTFRKEENHIAYRNGVRYVARLKNVSDHTDPINLTEWKAPKAALITGGLGALGQEVAKFLTHEGTKYLLLIGMTPLPNREKWPSIEEQSLQEKIAAITELERNGATVEYVAVDVTNKEKMQLAINETEQAWQQPIEGVFHLAGITTDNLPIASMSQETLYEVLSVKAKGALALHEIFKTTHLNCFVLFSSIVTLPYFGMRGLSAYAAANAFLNGLAYWRRHQGLPATSISWAAWADKGMSFKYNHSEFLETVGMSILALDQGMEILKYILAAQPTNRSIFKIDWQKFLNINPDARQLPFFEYFSAYIPKKPFEHFSTTLNREQIEQQITKTFCESLGLSITEVNTKTSLQTYGLDSIIGIKFVSNLSEHFPGVLSPMDLYRYPTLHQITDYILQKTQTTLSSTPTEDTLGDIAELEAQQVCDLLEAELAEINEECVGM
jgi:polyketide synthase PksL